MTGSPAPPLTELFEILQGERIPGQMQKGIEEHGTMPRGQDETVPVRPAGITGMMLQEPGPQDIGHGGVSHRHPGMTGPGFLHPVHGQHSYGIDTQLIQILLTHHLSALSLFYWNLIDADKIERPSRGWYFSEPGNEMTINYPA